MSQIKRICLFGTSANPPTGLGGHAGIVQYLASMTSSTDETHSTSLLFHEIRVLPVYKHMFHEKRNILANFQDRLELCKLAFGNIPNVVISDDEKVCFDRIANQQNITEEEERRKLRVGFIDLLEMLLERDGMQEFTLAVGTDTFMDLSTYKWRRSKDIFQLLKGRIVIFRRKGAGTEVDVQTLEDRIDEVARQLKDICPDLKQNVRLVEVPSLSEISSSLVRSTNDESVISQALNANVLNYIKEKKMYSFQTEV